MLNQALILGTDVIGLDLIAERVREVLKLEPRDGRKSIERGGPAKNWVQWAWGLVVVDYSSLGTKVVRGLNLMGVDDQCAALRIPLIIVSSSSDDYVTIGKAGGPYEDENLNPPFRMVTDLAGLNDALRKFELWRLSR